MDLNELLHRHQMSLLCAQNASSPEARVVHEGLAELYADHIRNLGKASPDDVPFTLSLQTR